MQDRLDLLRRFYDLMDELERVCRGARRLGECSSRLGWPRRGVYFFREDGEHRSDTGAGPRIVRVGTHALNANSRTKLWTRLRQHRGRQDPDGGNHRGSIFRMIVGAALVDRHGRDCPTWGVRRVARKDVRAGENALEREVSRTIGAMPLLWVAIDDEPGLASLRGDIERNAIALLSNFDREPIDAPSENWLGHHCNRERVRKSGLWNSNHVDEAFDPAFLDRLGRFIAAMKAAG